MKWVKVAAILLLVGIGFVAQQQLVNAPDVKESIGSTDSANQNTNEEVAKTRKDLLLPDLNISPPKQLYIQVKDGVKKLRFNTTFFNTGKGPLELVGTPDEKKKVTTATQVLQKVDGGTEQMVIGEFVFHPGHKHWHVDRYAQFQLWQFDSAGQQTDLVASTDKFSFCIWDEHHYDLTLENAPQTRQYQRCPENVQGNSVGWGDTYPAHLEGQELTITHVEDGKYLVRSTINADNAIFEMDYSNNSATAYIDIKGNTVTLLENF